MPTSNPIPSSDPSDLLFNAQKLDETVNSASLTFTDRLGAPRKTMAGIQAAFDAQLADAESDLNVYRADAAASAAEALGYLQTYRATSYGAYASDPATDPLGNPPTVGDEYFNTTANLLKRWNGTTWQASDINTANLAAPSGSSLVGYTPAGTGVVATTVETQLRKIITTTDKAVDLSGVSQSGAALRALISDAPDGSAVIFKAGAYLVDRDGTNPYCLHFSKNLHLIFEPGVIIKSSAVCRTVIRVSAMLTHEGAPVIDGNYKTNHAVECVAGAKGTTFKKWVGKKVTQQYDAGFAACPFSTVSEVGVIFDDCEASDAISYPNAVIGDAAGSSRGFHFYGTSPSFGINAVVNSRIKNIINTNGISGDYEDEDGITAQMVGSFTLIDNNTTIDCMKRGIKTENRVMVSNNKVISTRTGADNAIEGAARMYSGISIYGDDSAVVNNEIASASEFGMSKGGSFYYGLELGISGQQKSRITASDNTVKIGATSNARSVELVRLWGALSQLTLADNKLSVTPGPTLNNTFGIRSDFDHASIYASVGITGNRIKNTVYPMQLKGGFSGDVSSNHLHDFTGGIGGIIIDPSASALRPKNVLLAGNFGFGVNDYTVRVNDTGAVGIQAVDNKTESTTVPAVYIAPGIRAFENGSFGGTVRPAKYFGSAPPTSGTWVRGDVAMNHDPRDASPVVEWRCQYGGTPGTWHAVSWITVRGSTGSRPTLTASDAGVQYLDTTLSFPNGKLITWTGTAWADATGATV